MGMVEKIRLRGTSDRHASALQLLQKSGDAAFIVRGHPRSIVMRCPSGCGQVITVNLDRREGPAWRVYQSLAGLTIYPSVDMGSGCRAHFIVQQSRIYDCDAFSPIPQPTSVKLQDRILSLLGQRASWSIELLADTLLADPWDIARSCRQLKKTGRLSESNEIVSLRRP